MLDKLFFCNAINLNSFFQIVWSRAKSTYYVNEINTRKRTKL